MSDCIRNSVWREQKRERTLNNFQFSNFHKLSLKLMEISVMNFASESEQISTNFY